MLSFPRVALSFLPRIVLGFPEVAFRCFPDSRSRWLPALVWTLRLSRCLCRAPHPPSLTEAPRAVRGAGPAAATMDTFLSAWLGDLSAMDALRCSAACRSAREALGADGVAAAAFAVTRPWTASGLPNPAGSLRLWRRAWAACSGASSEFQMRGGAWLKTGTVIPTIASRSDGVRRPPFVAVTLDSSSARELAEHGMGIWGLYSSLRRAIAVLLISLKEATFDTENRTCDAEFQMLVLFADSQFAVATVTPWRTGPVQLTPYPLDVLSGSVIADGSVVAECRRLLVPAPARPPSRIRAPTSKMCVSLDRLSSGMKRRAPDGEAYDLFDFEVRYEGSLVARERWREAPPLDEVQDECEIALEGMLTMSARRILARKLAASGATFVWREVGRERAIEGPRSGPRRKCARKE